MQYTSPDVYEFISEQTHDPVVERKTCAVSGTQFPIYQSDVDFYEKISPTYGGVTFAIPTPNLCPEERQRRRLMFRNERALYKRKCDATGESMISMYSPESSIKAYKNEYRRSDTWDALSYGCDFNFSKTFTSQFKDLSLQVPRMNLAVSDNDNANYVNYSNYSKDCYLIYGNHQSERCMYGRRLHNCLLCVDCNQLSHCEHCYECSNCEKCFSMVGSQHCQDCRNCLYCYECTGCSDCLFSVNLTNKKYHIFNVSYTKESFLAKKKELISSLENSKRIYQSLLDKLPHKALDIVQSTGSIGSGLVRTKEATFAFSAQDCHHCSYIFLGEEATSCHSCDVVGWPSELCYEGISTCVNAYMNLFSSFCWSCQFISYCESCFHCQNLFGCVGLRHKQYCIFNNQYTKEEYESLVPKIIEHMQHTGERGSFLDISLSPFGYNETIAQEYFPLSKEKALEQGFVWQDNTYDPIIPNEIETLTGDQIPNSIHEVDNNILKKILICEVSGRPYRIIQQELDFYRHHTISLPKKHPDIRYKERSKGKMNLYLRACDKTGKEMISIYPGDTSFKVFSEEAYQQEIFS